MRTIVLASLLILVALLGSACGGPDDPEAALTAACERQLEEVADEASGTPTAKSSDERLDEVTLSQCAGQQIHLEPDAEPDDDGSTRDSDGADEGASEDPGTASTDDETADDSGLTAVALDPAAREAFTTSCGSCHMLSDADTSGQIGPGLDDTDFDADMVEQRIIEGAAGMPAGLLEGDEARSVAEYVAAAAAQAKADGG